MSFDLNIFQTSSSTTCTCSTDSCSFQISTDGYVSLSNPSSSSEFARLPLPAPNTSPIIAPLWMRTTNLRIFFSNILDYRVADDIETLSAISAIIMDSNSELINFHPKIAAIATLFFGVNIEVCVENAASYRLHQLDMLQPGTLYTRLLLVYSCSIGKESRNHCLSCISFGNVP